MGRSFLPRGVVVDGEPCARRDEEVGVVEQLAGEVGELRSTLDDRIRQMEAALETKADSEALVKSQEDLHEALEGLVTRAGGEYVHGPQKAAERIAEKAKNDYDGDVARVVDVERATGLFDSLDDLNAAVSVLREASSDGSLTIRRFKASRKPSPSRRRLWFPRALLATHRL